MELCGWFLTGLTDYDPSLTAVLDDQEETIHICYQKSGKKSLAYSVKRKYAELYPELQRRILKELPLKDVWKIHGSGKAYDDFLDEEERKHRESKQRDFDNRREDLIKENRWSIASALENARAGRFRQEEARPMEIPRIVVPHIPKEGESEK